MFDRFKEWAGVKKESWMHKSDEKSPVEDKAEQSVILQRRKLSEAIQYRKSTTRPPMISYSIDSK